MLTPAYPTPFARLQQVFHVILLNVERTILIDASLDENTSGGGVECKMKLVGLIIGIVGLMIAVYFVVIPWALSRFAPVVVKPREISLQEQPWRIKTTFWVKNSTDETPFDVWIKVSVDAYDVKSSDIWIDTKEAEGFLWESISNISIDYEYVRIDGIDNKGKQCIFFILYHLPPQVPQPFIIKVESKSEIKEGRNRRILLEVVHHSKEPVKLLKKNQEIAYPFTPPENFTINSISLKMKRE